MSNVSELPDFGYFQVQFLISTPNDRMVQSLASLPLRVVVEHKEGSLGGRQVINNATNAHVKEVLSQLSCSGFHLMKMYRQEWKSDGLCVGFLFAHESLGKQKMELFPEVAEAFRDLNQSTWRYLHVWESSDSPGLLSTVCIDKSMRNEPDVEVCINNGHLGLITCAKKVPKKARLKKVDKANMLEARRLLERLKMG
ncbi:MAG: hypothetical protein ACYCY6_00550 [Minisyncoccota bacterium]